MFRQLFLLNIRPWWRTLLKRQLLFPFLVLPMFILQLSYTDFGAWTEYMRIFYLFMVMSFGFLLLLSSYTLRIESHFINLVYTWNYKTLYSYFVSKCVIGAFFTLIYFLLYYFIVPMKLEVFLGSSIFSIGMSICLGLLVVPYNNYSLDLFDKAKMRENSMKGATGYLTLVIMILMTALLCMPVYFALPKYVYWIYFAVGLPLMLLMPLWIKISVKQIVKRKYTLIDSLSK